jgi:hypothetical protein
MNFDISIKFHVLIQLSLKTKLSGRTYDTCFILNPSIYAEIINTKYFHGAESLKSNISSSSRDILRFLWNLKVRYCVRKNQPQIAILSLMNPVHTLQPNTLRFVFILRSHYDGVF